MKNRLLLLALTTLCGAQIQAGSWWNRFRNYSPYQYSSFQRYAPENVTSRLATMRYLYGNQVAQDQQELINDYEQDLAKKANWMERLLDAQEAQWVDPKAQLEARWNPRLWKCANPHKGTEDINYVQRINQTGKMLRPTIQRTEAQLLNPASYHQYQHPDQYILNN
jgi:hypothetical protein